MRTQEPRYFAYMLRLWQVGSDEGLTWRASLESPRTGERHGFASLEALFEFLREQTESQPLSQAVGTASQVTSVPLSSRAGAKC
jgi:hypothetical protein